jgi:hypothetical protein
MKLWGDVFFFVLGSDLKQGSGRWYEQTLDSFFFPDLFWIKSYQMIWIGSRNPSSTEVMEAAPCAKWWYNLSTESSLHPDTGWSSRKRSKTLQGDFGDCIGKEKGRDSAWKIRFCYCRFYSSLDLCVGVNWFGSPCVSRSLNVATIFNICFLANQCRNPWFMYMILYRFSAYFLLCMDEYSNKKLSWLWCMWFTWMEGLICHCTNNKVYLLNGLAFLSFY